LVCASCSVHALLSPSTLPARGVKAASGLSSSLLLARVQRETSRSPMRVGFVVVMEVEVEIQSRERHRASTSIEESRGWWLREGHSVALDRMREIAREN